MDTRPSQADPVAFTHAFVERPLEPHELAADAPGDRPGLTVLEPGAGASGSDAAACFGRHAGAIDEKLHETGALLFRGFAIPDTESAEALVLALGIELDASYLGGASPRSGLTRYLFTSTEAPRPYIISFHTEMCYLRHRPSRVIFYCETAPERVGETPLFDCARMVEELPRRLVDRIEAQGIVYERHFRQKPSRINVYKTWADAFGTRDRDAVEAACRRQGLDFQWRDDGDLVARTRMPGIVRHPVTGQRCVSLTLYNPFAASHDIARFAHRYNPLVRLAISSFSNFMFRRPKIFMRTLWGDGEPIGRDDTRTLIDAAWRSSTVFRWQRGDLLILDNIRTGHGRLNVTGPRRIAAGLGNPYDVARLAAA